MLEVEVAVAAAVVVVVVAVVAVVGAAAVVVVARDDPRDKHPARIERDCGRKASGDAGYARKELVAEMATALLRFAAAVSAC